MGIRKVQDAGVRVADIDALVYLYAERVGKKLGREALGTPEAAQPQ